MIVTAKDAQDRLAAYLGDNVGQAGTRDGKRAVADALRELGTAHRWTYLFSEHLLTTSAPQSSSTVTYDAATRRATIAAGTWPTWAQYGVLILDDTTHSRVSQRVSSTVLELESASAPGADSAAGTSYVLYRDLYPMPADFHQGGLVMRSAGREYLEWCSPETWHQYGSPYNVGGGRPARCTLIGQPENYGRMALQVAPYPTEVETFRMVYKRLPRTITTWEYKAGTIAVSGSTVTGTSTAWTSAMAGTVLRVGTTTTDYPSDLDNPPVDELRVASVESTTSLTVDGTFSAAHSGVKYSLSDPIDIEYGAMLNAFWLCCYKQLASHRELKNKPNIIPQYLDALARAQGDDLRNWERKNAGAHWRKWGWPE